MHSGRKTRAEKAGNRGMFRVVFNVRIIPAEAGLVYREDGNLSAGDALFRPAPCTIILMNA